MRDLGRAGSAQPGRGEREVRITAGGSLPRLFNTDARRRVSAWSRWARRK